MRKVLKPRDQVSQAYKKLNITKENISLHFEGDTRVLSFNITCCVVSVAIVPAVLDRISGLEPS